MDLPSALLKGLGIFLVLTGIIGTVSGIYAVKLVYEYKLTPETAVSVKSSISEISSKLEKKKSEVDTSLVDTSINLNDASSAVMSAGNKTGSASAYVSAASKNLTKAAENLRSAASLDRDTSIYLSRGAYGLKSWADNYEFNGTILPEKSSFKRAAEDIETAAQKIEESSRRLETAAENIENTASNLRSTSLQLKETSKELYSTGANLNQSSRNIQKLKNPLGSVILDISEPLRDSLKSIETIVRATSDAKTVAYAVLGYFILLHLILLGLGIALIVIEVNLFYPMTKELES